jgi:hypothetical protein
MQCPDAPIVGGTALNIDAKIETNADVCRQAFVIFDIAISLHKRCQRLQDCNVIF